MIVRLEDGPVHAFGAVRQVDIQVGEERVAGRVLHDFYVSEADEYGWRAAGILLDEVCRGTTLSLAAGLGMHTGRLIESQRWLALGEFSRWRVEPEKIAKPRPLPRAEASDAESRPRFGELASTHLRGDPEVIRWLHGDDGAVHVVRGPGGAAIAFARRVAAARPGTHEWHVTELIPNGDVSSEFFRLLGAALRATGEAAYMSVFAPVLETEIQRSGWERQRARWPVYSYFGSSRDRALAARVARGDAWFLTPMDVALDRE